MAFRINQLTQHRPTKEPHYYKNQEFAQYLAGVIDARGQFTDDGGVELQYRLRDARNAYALRSLLGHGKVRIKTQKGIQRAILRIDGLLGFREISLHIHGNLRNPKRIQEFNHIFYEKLKFIRIPTPSNQPIQWDSPWLAGLADGSGSFLNLTVRMEVFRRRHQARISFEMTIDNKWLLSQIKDRFGGYVVQSKVQKGLYHYSTVAGKFKTVYQIIKYFDKYPPQYHFFYLRYTVVRKAWLILQQEEYYHPRRTKGLTQAGLIKMMTACHRHIPKSNVLNITQSHKEIIA